MRLFKNFLLVFLALTFLQVQCVFAEEEDESTINEEFAELEKVRGALENPIPNIKLTKAFPNLKFNRPLWMCQAPDGTERWFVLQQRGLIKVFSAKDDTKGTEVFLDISSFVKGRAAVMGLLAMAFHPNYKTNGKFYLWYMPSRRGPAGGYLVEYKVSKDNPHRADPKSRRLIMKVDLLTSSPHNGGTFCNMPRCSEQNADWATGCIRYMREHGLTRITTTVEAENAWAEHVEEGVRGTLLHLGNSWFFGANTPGKKRVFQMYAGGAPAFRAKCDEVAAKGYEGFVLS